MKAINHFLGSLFFLFLIILSSCQPETAIEAPDVSHIDPQISWVSTENLINEIADQPDFDEAYTDLSTKYAAFFDIYNEHILPVHKGPSANGYEAYQKLFKDTVFINLREQVSSYIDQTKLQAEYKKACQYLNYYLPEIDAPDIYTFISIYNYQLFLFGKTENKMGVGLDMFLNAYVPYKKIDPKNPNFSAYLTRSYTKEHIVSKIIANLLEEEIKIKTGSSFLDQIVTKGKLLHIKKLLLPMHHDTIIHEHSLEQWNWLESNEKEIFSFFKDKNLFYESDQSKFMRYVHPGPNSPGMPSSAPGRTGDFIGYKIVQAYLAKNKELSLAELININANDIFQKSRYKPPR